MPHILMLDMELFRPYLEFAQQVMGAPSELSEAQRELTAIYARATPVSSALALIAPLQRVTALTP